MSLESSRIFYLMFVVLLFTSHYIFSHDSQMLEASSAEEGSRNKPFNRLSQVCYMGNSLSFTKYQAHAKTIFLLNDNFKSMDLIYELQRSLDKTNFSELSQTIIEFNPHNYLIKIDGEFYNPKKHNLHKIIECDYLEGFGSEDVEYIQKILYEHYDVHLDLIVDKESYLLVESKTNTAEAVNQLKEKYKFDAKMMYYLDLFLVNGGLINGVDELISLFNKNKDKGIVLKLAEGDGGSGVFIISVKDIQRVLELHAENNDQGVYLEPLKKYKRLYDEFALGMVISWQEYIPPENVLVEQCIQFFNNEKLLPAYTTSEIIDIPRYVGSLYEAESIDSLFSELDSEAKDYYVKIVRELMSFKVNLDPRYKHGLKDEKLKLKSFDTSTMIVEMEGKKIPKLYEINARLCVNMLMIDEQENGNEYSSGKDSGYLWLCLPYVYLTENMNAKTFVSLLNKTINTFRKQHPDYLIDFSRLICPLDMHAVKGYLAVRPVSKKDINFWKQEAINFSHLLRDNITTGRPAISN